MGYILKKGPLYLKIVENKESTFYSLTDDHHEAALFKTEHLAQIAAKKSQYINLKLILLEEIK